MAKEYDRKERIADLLKKEVAKLIQFKVRDPRVGLITISGVEVSKDLAYATVYVTQLDEQSSEDETKQDEMIVVLNKASGFLRSELSKTNTMRISLKELEV